MAARARKGSARTTFVVGALLTLPGASYLAGLSRIDKLNYSTPETVALVVAFNVVMLVLLEIPVRASRSLRAGRSRHVARAKGMDRRHGHRFAVILLAVLGSLLVIKGLIELLS